MPNTVEEYLVQPYTRILIPNADGSYSAEILEFYGCFADGETPNEAIQNLENAAKSWLSASIEQGLDVPEPFYNQDFGGKIALRLPRSLHRQASRMAQRDGVSLNQFLVSAISEKVGAENLFTQLVHKFEQRMTASTLNIHLTQFVTRSIPSSPVLSQPTIQLPDYIVVGTRQEAK